MPKSKIKRTFKSNKNSNQSPKLTRKIGKQGAQTAKKTVEPQKSSNTFRSPNQASIFEQINPNPELTLQRQPNMLQMSSIPFIGTPNSPEDVSDNLSPTSPTRELLAAFKSGEDKIGYHNYAEGDGEEYEYEGGSDDLPEETEESIGTHNYLLGSLNEACNQYVQLASSVGTENPLYITNMMGFDVYINFYCSILEIRVIDYNNFYKKNKCEEINVLIENMEAGGLGALIGKSFMPSWEKNWGKPAVEKAFAGFCLPDGSALGEPGTGGMALGGQTADMRSLAQSSIFGGGFQLANSGGGGSLNSGDPGLELVRQQLGLEPSQSGLAKNQNLGSGLFGGMNTGQGGGGLFGDTTNLQGANLPNFLSNKEQAVLLDNDSSKNLLGSGGLLSGGIGNGQPQSSSSSLLGRMKLPAKNQNLGIFGQQGGTQKQQDLTNTLLFGASSQEIQQLGGSGGIFGQNNQTGSSNTLPWFQSTTPQPGAIPNLTSSISFGGAGMGNVKNTTVNKNALKGFTGISQPQFQQPTTTPMFQTPTLPNPPKIGGQGFQSLFRRPQNRNTTPINPARQFVAQNNIRVGGLGGSFMSPQQPSKTSIMGGNHQGGAFSSGQRPQSGNPLSSFMVMAPNRQKAAEDRFKLDLIATKALCAKQMIENFGEQFKRFEKGFREEFYDKPQMIGLEMEAQQILSPGPYHRPQTQFFNSKEYLGRRKWYRESSISPYASSVLNRNARKNISQLFGRKGTDRTVSQEKSAVEKKRESVERTDKGVQTSRKSSPWISRRGGCESPEDESFENVGSVGSSQRKMSSSFADGSQEVERGASSGKKGLKLDFNHIDKESKDGLRKAKRGSKKNRKRKESRLSGSDLSSQRSYQSFSSAIKQKCLRNRNNKKVMKPRNKRSHHYSRSSFEANQSSATESSQKNQKALKDSSRLIKPARDRQGDSERSTTRKDAKSTSSRVKSKPSMKQIKALPLEMRKSIKNFTVYNKYGKIEFLAPVDLSKVHYLSSVVSITKGVIKFYPFARSKMIPEKGVGINQPCFLNLYGMFGRDDNAHRRVKKRAEEYAKSVDGSLVVCDAERNELKIYIEGF